MKKLFTLALALLIATAGFSQVRKMSSKDIKKNSATKMVTKGMESFENVQNQPNMTRSEGELDYTTYDWQSNSGARTWTIVWPDNKVNFAYTIASDASFSDRGTGIGTYDYENDAWTALGGRIENEKTGFGSIARYKENGIVVAAHTATNLALYIVENKDNMVPNSVSPSVNIGTDAYSHPAVMTSGPERDIIHMVAAEFEESDPDGDGIKHGMRYWRSSDGGLTWDKTCVELPFMTAEYGTEHGTNAYYWMETTEDNCLALVINTGCTDGMVIYSYDNGETWERKVYFHDPAPGVLLDASFAYPRWTSVQWNSNKQLMMAYEFNFSDHQGHYGPGTGGVAFWSEYLPYYGESTVYGCDPNNPMPPEHGKPFIMDSAYINSDIYSSLWFWSNATHEMWPEYFGYFANINDETGDPEEDQYNPQTDVNITATTDFENHGSYNNGVSGMPVLCKVDNSDSDLVAVWSAIDEMHKDGDMFYFKLFAAYSGDGGLSWSPQKQLTNDFMYELSECVYPQAAVIGHTLIVAAQFDPDADSYVQGNDADESNNLYQGLTFELEDLFPNVGVSEVSHNTHMNIYPNPATDRLNVTLSQNAEIEVYNIMGQKVMSLEGHAGANTLNISELNAGIYFVNAGADTQKFIVK